MVPGPRGNEVAWVTTWAISTCRQKSAVTATSSTPVAQPTARPPPLASSFSVETASKPRKDSAAMLTALITAGQLTPLRHRPSSERCTCPAATPWRTKTTKSAITTTCTASSNSPTRVVICIPARFSASEAPTNRAVNSATGTAGNRWPSAIADRMVSSEGISR